MIKIKLNLAKAQPLAEKIKASLAPGCERIESVAQSQTAAKCDTYAKIELPATA